MKVAIHLEANVLDSHIAKTLLECVTQVAQAADPDAAAFMTSGVEL